MDVIPNAFEKSGRFPAGRAFHCNLFIYKNSLDCAQDDK